MGRSRLQQKVGLLFDRLSCKEKVKVKQRYGDNLVSWYLDARITSIRRGLDRKDVKDS